MSLWRYAVKPIIQKIFSNSKYHVNYSTVFRKMWILFETAKSSKKVHNYLDSFIYTTIVMFNCRFINWYICIRRLFFSIEQTYDRHQKVV